MFTAFAGLCSKYNYLNSGKKEKLSFNLPTRKNSFAVNEKITKAVSRQSFINLCCSAIEVVFITTGFCKYNETSNHVKNKQNYFPNKNALMAGELGRFNGTKGT